MDRAAQTRETNEQILETFNTDSPNFAFVCGGLRRVAVNPQDTRARRMLLKKGIRYFSKNQFFIYACAHYLKSDLFLDIGTNYGECLYSLPLYSQIPSIGFEANSNLLKYLERTRAYNDDIGAIEVRNFAVSNLPDQTVKFFVDNKWSGKSALGVSGGRDTTEIEVKTTTLDAVVSGFQNCENLLVKIDVEGFEPVVFLGARETCQRVGNAVFLIEFDADMLRLSESSAEDFYDTLARQFTVYELRNSGLEPTASFSELQERHREKSRIHTDLVLTKFKDNELSQCFKSKIASIPFRKLRTQLWGMT